MDSEASRLEMHRTAWFETGIGTCGLAWSDLGITRVFVPAARPRDGDRGTDARDVPEVVRPVIAGIVALLDGDLRDLGFVALDERAVDHFARRVYAATRRIAPGVTASYGEVARAIGEPAGARAVGAALARNPFPLIVPCHRVLAATGALHGFSAPGGIATKRRLLEIEQAPGFTQAPLFV
jgi:methylated-DNA-[protein]-cysteine S-methyltransferase